MLAVFAALLGCISLLLVCVSPSPCVLPGVFAFDNDTRSLDLWRCSRGENGSNCKLSLSSREHLHSKGMAAKMIFWPRHTNQIKHSVASGDNFVSCFWWRRPRLCVALSNVCKSNSDFYSLTACHRSWTNWPSPLHGLEKIGSLRRARSLSK